jgi:methyltransferase (TIGR00027 family)
MTADADAPDSTAIRVALWRALHLEVDDPPHVIVDDVGLRLAQPNPDWRARGDMHVTGTASFRASIVGRARFVDDLVSERASSGVVQYVVLGAGLDTFAQRHPELTDTLHVYEVDQPDPQAWKRRRLNEEGLEAPTFVPVDFESGESWWDALRSSGFDTDLPAVISSTGVSMYLTRHATKATLQQLAALAPRSVLAMTFMVPMEFVDDAERQMQADVERAAHASGTPFISHYAPEEMLAMCRDAGFSAVHHVSPADLVQRYFAERTDGLRPPGAEHFVVAEL